MRRDERMARGRATRHARARSHLLHGLSQRLRGSPAARAQDGEIIEIGGGKRVRFVDTPHTPHGWDAGVVYEESTRTLLCGDLFTQLGNAPSDGDIVGPAIAAEDVFKYSSLNPGMGSTIRSLSELQPRTLALMHGPIFTGDGAAALSALADDYDRRLADQAFAVLGLERIGPKP